MGRLFIAALLFIACSADHQNSAQDLSGVPSDFAVAADAAAKTYDCKAPPSDLAACTNATDCGSVALGCYCGQQPVTGVGLKYQAAATSCETAAAASCPLACPVQAGQKADDGKTIPDGTSPTVACDSGMCRTHVP
jgi:hypothetical protein